MNHLHRISSILLAMLLIASLECDIYARGNRGRRAPANYFSFSVAGGYSNIITYDDVAKPYGFAGGMVGLGYEMHAGGFWWSVTGEAECLTSSIAIDEKLVTAQNPAFSVTRWRECPHYLFVGVPLLMGYRTDDFYIGAGPKLMLTLYCHDISYLNYTYGGGQYTSKQLLNLDNNLLNAAACFEIGGTILGNSSRVGRSASKRRYIHTVARTGLMLKLGFYAEYGFMNLNATQGTGSVVTVGTDRLDIIPLFTSNTMTNTKATPFFAGIKLTLLYGR